MLPNGSPLPSTPRSSDRLPDLLASRARAASDARLVVNAGAGLLAGAAALAWRPPGWALVLAIAGCFFAYGLWGVADRSVRESSGRRGRVALQTLRAAAAGLGVVAGLAALLAGFALALGRWIS